MLVISLAIVGIGCSNIKDHKEIKSVVNEYNETLEKAYFEDEVKNSEELFVDSNTLEESNWKNKLVYLMNSNSEYKERNESIDFNYINIKNNFARAVIVRNTERLDENSELYSPGVEPEAYLLQKIDGKWKIHSIFEVVVSPEKEKYFKEFAKSDDIESYGKSKGRYYVETETETDTPNKYRYEELKNWFEEQN